MPLAYDNIATRIQGKKEQEMKNKYSKKLQFLKCFWQYLLETFIGAELAGAAGARAPPLFDPRPEIL